MWRIIYIIHLYFSFKYLCPVIIPTTTNTRNLIVKIKIHNYTLIRWRHNKRTKARERNLQKGKVGEILHVRSFLKLKKKTYYSSKTKSKFCFKKDFERSKESAYDHIHTQIRINRYKILQVVHFTILSISNLTLDFVDFSSFSLYHRRKFCYKNKFQNISFMREFVQQRTKNDSWKVQYLSSMFVLRP